MLLSKLELLNMEIEKFKHLSVEEVANMYVKTGATQKNKQEVLDWAWNTVDESDLRDFEIWRLARMDIALCIVRHDHSELFC